MGTVTRLRRGGSVVRPSPMFIGVLGLTVLAGFATWQYGALTKQSIGTFYYYVMPARLAPERIAIFLFVIAGWIVSLCLHEFGHAILAYRNGDRSVASKGYLGLNPLKYGDPILSFGIPVLFVLLGGIGLPGGAVWIDRGAIRGGRWRHSVISAAGPAVNLVLAVLLALAVGQLSDDGHNLFWSALAFLVFLQVTAAVLNILPIPGLDGFGIIEPYLPRDLVRKANEIGGYVFIVLLALLWVPAINHQFFDLIFHITDALGVHSVWIDDGERLFRFWTSS